VASCVGVNRAPRGSGPASRMAFRARRVPLGRRTPGPSRPRSSSPTAMYRDGLATAPRLRSRLPAFENFHQFAEIAGPDLDRWYQRLLAGCLVGRLGHGRNCGNANARRPACPGSLAVWCRSAHGSEILRQVAAIPKRPNSFWDDRTRPARSQAQLSISEPLVRPVLSIAALHGPRVWK